MLTTIPFSGFYETEHDAEIDYAFNFLMYEQEGLIHKIWDKVNWSGVREAYGKHYAEKFVEHFKIKATFESMRSPKEYNFTTDRLFMEIEVDEVKRILKTCSREVFLKKAKAKFTTRSGFISYYSPDPEDWGDVETWDHNQVGCLIEAYAEHIGDINRELDLMEDVWRNGNLDNWFYANCEDMNRWVTLAKYIYERSNR